MRRMKFNSVGFYFSTLGLGRGQRQTRRCRKVRGLSEIQSNHKDNNKNNKSGHEEIPHDRFAYWRVWLFAVSVFPGQHKAVMEAFFMRSPVADLQNQAPALRL